MRLANLRKAFMVRIPKFLRIVLGIVVIAASISAILLHRYWPFSESEIREQLREAASSQVNFGNFHTRYFPPGCVAEEVVFQKDGAAAPLVTVRRLQIYSDLIGLFRHHVSLIRAEGMRVNWSGWRDNQRESSSSTSIVDRLVADDAVLEIPRNDPEGSLQFVFHHLELKDLRGPDQTSFNAVFDNPLPRGILRASGKFGPWNVSHPSDTLVSGQYSLEHADMSVFHSITGFLSSTGRFEGKFRQIQIQGHTDTPALAPANTRHALPLGTDFRASVDGTNGDVFLDRVKAQFGKDELDIQGSIARRNDGRRTAILNFQCNRGRVEDTFYPFIHSPRPGLTGNIQFRMRVSIPSGDEQFLKRVSLESAFRIEDARFTHHRTRENVSKVGQKPGQHPDPEAPVNLQGEVSLHGGIAQFSELAATDDGAAASFRGKYNLTDERVDLHGELKTEASLSNMTHGIKAVFAKVIEPFFKKRPHETVIPVKIGGTYSHPSFGLDTG